jgi:hypothetical protein
VDPGSGCRLTLLQFVYQLESGGPGLIHAFLVLLAALAVNHRALRNLVLGGLRWRWRNGSMRLHFRGGHPHLFRCGFLLRFPALDDV